MPIIRVIQVGLGPLGQKTARYIGERQGIEIVGAIDINPELKGKLLSDLTGIASQAIPIDTNVAGVQEKVLADAAILTTVSTMELITEQIEEIVDLGIPVVSTCEELLHPWNTATELARRIDEKAKRKGVAVLGTGVNPGFLMDSLPAMMSAVCQEVDRVDVVRKQNAAFRRVPFQKKIGAGLDVKTFKELVETKTIRHVGLAESIYLIADAMDWKLDEVTDSITPVIAEEEIRTDAMTIKSGDVAGVQQIGVGKADGEEKIRLVFKASIGEPEPEDSIEIHGEPSIKSSIEGGLHGDVATCAITINAVKKILDANPGLRTMADMPLVSFLR